MKSIFVWGVILGLFFGFIQGTFSEEPQATIDIDKDQVVLGDMVRMTITLQGLSPSSPPELPKIPDFDVRYLGSRTETYSHVTVIVQGKKVEEKRTGGGTEFEYALTPKKTGTLVIPPFSFTVDGERFQSSTAFPIRVTDTPPKREDIFVNLSVTKNHLYLGESVLLTFEWFFDKRLEDYSLQIPWYGELKDFLVEEPKGDPKKEYVQMIINDKEKVTAEKKTVTLHGKTYGVLSFQRILTPIAAGVYTLDPTFLRVEVVTGYQAPRKRTRFFFKEYFDWAFDDFFGKRPLTETVVARSEPMVLSVKPLPEENKPATFSGGVGHFDFQATAEPTTVQAGEPVTVTMKVVGTGNFRDIRFPDFPELPAFKTYAPETRTESNFTEEGLFVGEKVFGKVLVGRREGAYEIPPLSFSYFDPEAETYKTVTQGPFSIRVEGGVTTQEEASLQKKEVTLLTHDIRYIKMDLGPIHHPEIPFYHNRLFWFLGFVPLPLMTVVSFIFQKRRIRLKEDVGYSRRLYAFKKALKGLSEAEHLLQKRESGACAATLSKLLTHFLGDKLNRPPAAITGEIVSVLEKERCDPELLRQVKGCFERLDLTRFSPAGGSLEEMKKLLEEVKSVVERLEKTIG